jgi:hypothetical protein
MLEDVVEKRLQDILGGLEDRVRSHLELCRSPSEKLLLLEFLQLPGAQPTWCRGEPDPLKMRISSGGFLDSAGVVRKGEREDGQGAPTGVVWLDDLMHHRVFFHEQKAECCRLIPRYPVKDEESGQTLFTIDLALFWPLGDGKGHIKIAIECNGRDSKEREEGPPSRENDKQRSLKERGWIICRLDEAEICKNPAAVVTEIRDLGLWALSQRKKDRRTA